MRPLAMLIACTYPFACAQIAIDGSRAAELLAQLDPQANSSLQCQVTAIAPALTFSFRFQTGYLVRVPLRQFRGPGHSLTMVTRVTPREGERQPVYLLRTFDLPNVPETDAAAELAGAFLAGEGHYQTNAILFDELRRVCRADWQFEVRPRVSQRLRLLLEPTQVAALSSVAENVPPDGSVQLERLSIFVHAASWNPRNAKMQARDVVTTVSAVAALMEQLPARSVRLVVFNLHQPKELYRNEEFNSNDLAVLNSVFDGVQLGMVDYG